MKRSLVLGCVAGILIFLTGCGREFEVVQGDKYRTERVEGVVVQDAARRDTVERTGAPAPTSTPKPPLKEQYEIPENSNFTFTSGDLSVEGIAEVVAPEGNAMPCYRLTVVDFSQEVVEVLRNVLCESLPEESGLAFEVRNLPREEDGMAKYLNQCARTVFYRNKEALKGLSNTLFAGRERMFTEEVQDENVAARLKAQGEDFLEKIGESGAFAVSRISEKKLDDGESLYLIDFQKQVRGIPLMENFGYSDREVLDNRIRLWSHEGMRLGIDAEGVCFFCWESPMEVGEEVKMGEILPFPVVQQTMITLLKENYEEKTDRVKVTKMELCYRSRYMEEGAVLLPVWNLYGATLGVNGTMGAAKLLLSINALTGEEMPPRSSGRKG